MLEIPEPIVSDIEVGGGINHIIYVKILALRVEPAWNDIWAERRSGSHIDKPVSFLPLRVFQIDDIWSMLERCIWCRVDRKLHVQRLAISDPRSTCTSLTLALSNVRKLARILAVVLGHRTCHSSACLIKTEDFAHMLRDFLEKGRLILLYYGCIFGRSDWFELFYIRLGDCGGQLSDRAPVYNLSSLMHEVDNLAISWWICRVHHVSNAMILRCLWPNFLQLWIVLLLAGFATRCNLV